MALPLFLADRAHEDVVSTCRWWSDNRSEQQADRWFAKLSATIDSVYAEPDRFGIASDNDSFPLEVRQANFGVGRKPTHRVLFLIRPDMTLVVRVLHLAQDELTADDLL